MTRRYFHPELPAGGGLVTLSGCEGQHAVQVMRVQTGDQIVLFDGKGCETAAEIVSIHRYECCCQCEAPSWISRESTVPVMLGIALPKPDRARELIERLTELGVCSVTPLVTERSQRPPSDALINKLRRTVVEASKQCGRNQLLIINDPLSVQDFILKNRQAADRWIAHPGGISREALAERHEPSTCVLIGPEGGWTEEELFLTANDGYRRLDLGKRILRIETAAAMVAGLLTD